MIVYHHTRPSAFAGIQKSGGIDRALCRKIFHPRLSAKRKEHTARPALWVLHEPYPTTWLKPSRDGAHAMEGLFEHRAKKEEPVILAVDIGDCRDLWAADYEEHMKDRRESSLTFIISQLSSRYQRSMRRFQSPDDLKGMVIPEIICFDFKRAKNITLLPPIPVPVPAARRGPKIDLTIKTSG